MPPVSFMSPGNWGVPEVPGGWPSWHCDLAISTAAPGHCGQLARACCCNEQYWAPGASCSSKELEQKLREGCEGSWEAETELGHFKIHYPDELVFILRRPFTNFRLPDLLEPLVQMHEMEDEPKGKNLKPALLSTPAPRFTKKNWLDFFFFNSGQMTTILMNKSSPYECFLLISQTMKLFY